MPLCFDRVSCAPLRDVTLRFPSGLVAGLIGPDDAGAGVLLRLAAGLVLPESGRIEAPGGAVFIEAGPAARRRLEDVLHAPPRLLLMEHALSLVDAAFQRRFAEALYRWRRQEALLLIASHDLPLIETLSDLVIAFEAGRVVEQGDPRLVISNYRRRLAEEKARRGAAAVDPVSRHGDRRVELETVAVLGPAGVPAATLRSGEEMTVRIGLCCRTAVANPVVGLQLWSRLGVVVYGTNTEAEATPIGPCAAGQNFEIDFRFRCDLCPGEYLLTLASHDPDGTPHDWLEHAVLFTVVDDRYTAGIANLRARVEVRY